MRCNYCEWRCDLSDGNTGVCRMYRVEGGKIKERFPNKWSTYLVNHIESAPFFHAFPGSRSLIIGTVGCNLDCSYCSNAYVAKEDPEKLLPHLFDLTPEKLVQIAWKAGCHNIVFNVNEPTVSMPSLIRLAKAARAVGLPMGCLSNGYMTEECTDLMASAFSFFNISLKGFSSEFYRQYTGIKSIDPILRNIKKLAAISHVEITTPIIQGVNDGEIGEIAAFISSVDCEIPWHVFRLLPEYKMTAAEYPGIEGIRESLDRVRPLLSYIYFHNFVGSAWVNTLCPGCGATVIERFSTGACGGGKLAGYLCRGNKCLGCGREIRVHGSNVEWNSREVV